MSVPLAVTPQRPRWERPALAGLLVLTGLLYVWGLGASGWANAFYSAAVQAGAHSWKAFFFGSSDAANFITVDKTPLALWPMDLAARVFGVNSWSILVPQALMGVATVGVLYATVRRSLTFLGPRGAAGGALLAGAVLATTPVAALMFRFNNPDALLVLLLTLGAYGIVRARESAHTGWLVFAGCCVGLGFLTKMLQAFLVLPAFALVYLVTAPTSLRRRLWQLAVAGAALVVSAGWWVAIVALVPAGSRPYIGGSQHDSVLELAFGYNGLGRLNGNETGGLGNTNQDAGWLRMFGAELGGQIAWLLPAALILLIAGLWAMSSRAGTREASETTPVSRPPIPAVSQTSALSGPETSALGGSQTSVVGGPQTSALGGPETSGMGGPETPAIRGRGWSPGGGRGTARTAPGPAGFAVWGGWLLITGAVFSLMQGIFHGYYTVALAPAVAALVGMGAAVLWRRRGHPAVSGVLAGTVAVTALWSYRLLGRTPDFAPWLRLTILVGGLIAAAALLSGRRLPSRALAIAAAAAVAVSLAGPSAYALDTAATSHTGAIPSAGPTGGGFPGGPGGRFGGPRGGFGGAGGGGFGGPGAGMRPGGMPQPPGGTGGAPGQTGGTGQTGGAGGTSGQSGGRVRGPGGGMGGPGALLDATTPSAALTATLKQNAGSYTWVAATVGSNSAAGYQLATGEPVMAIGGFNGTDPAPSLARFQQYVRAGRIHYFIGGSMTMRGNGSGSGDAQQIATWVAQNFTARTVGGVTIYDLG